MIALLFILFARPADQVAAIVGDEIILESEVAENIAFLLNYPMAQKIFASGEELRNYVLNGLISSKLLLAQAEAESIIVTTEELQNRVKEIIEGVKERFPTEADFYKALEEQNLTIEDLKRQYEKELRSDFLMQRLIQKKWGTKIAISPIAVQKFYEEKKDSIAIVPGRVKLAHILLAIRPNEEELKKGFQRAAEVYGLLTSGGEFSVIAQEFSDDVNSKRKGGMLGRIKKGETFEEFERAIFSLKPGVVSQPFLTRLGYHIVEVINKGADWVLARQILIKVEITRADSLRCEKLAQKLRDQISRGANFDSLAKVYSADPNIDLGEFFINQLTPPFDKVVKGLDEAEVSEPFQTPYGYHLLYVKEKVPEKFLTFEELRDKIYQYLYQQELETRYQQLIEELKQKTFVKVFEKKETTRN